MLRDSLHDASLKFATALFLSTLLIPAGCDRSPERITSATSGYQVADGTTGTRSTTDSDDSSPPVQPPTMTELQGHQTRDDAILKVPEGTTEELLEHFDRLLAYQPSVLTQGEAIAAMLQVFPVHVEAADQLLERDLSDERRAEISEVKIRALQMLILLDVEGVDDRLNEYLDSLAASENPEDVTRANLTRFQMILETILAKKSNDVAALIEQLTTVLEQAEINRKVFLELALTPNYLSEADLDDAADQISELLGAAFVTSSDPEIAEAGNMMLMNAAVSAMHERGDQASVDRMMEFIPPLLERNDLQSLIQVAKTAEFCGFLDEARQLYHLAIEALGQHPEADSNGQVQAMLSEFLEHTENLQNMLGKPIDLEGRLSDGTPFDWSAYRGQVILVDFWATHCPPCLAAFPEMKDLFEEYHDQGFDIVGINLDEEMQKVDRVLATFPLPWTTVLVNSPEEAGVFNNPNTLRYHVDVLPFTILVDRQGNAVLVHPRGERLKTEIERLLAEPAPPAAEAAEVPAEGAAESDPPSDTSRLSDRSEWFIAFTEDPAAEPESAAPAEDETEEEGPSVGPSNINPYAPPSDLSRLELFEYILDMDERPRSIQVRPGFNKGIVEACDQFLADNPQGPALEVATSTRLTYLHRQSCRGDEEAQERLNQLTNELAADMPQDAGEGIVEQVAFYQIESRALAVDDLPADEVPQLLGDLADFMQDRDLGEPHLQLASQTAWTINRLPQEDREPYFQKFSEIWSESSDTQLARYGERISRISDQAVHAQQIGQTAELAGVTTEGDEFDVSTYRGQVVLVDFWATWCGTCRQELPTLEALYQQYHEQGLEVVGVGLDDFASSLAAFLERRPQPWPTLAGPECHALARRYNVRMLPMMMLIDREGKIVAIEEGIGPLREQFAAMFADTPTATEDSP